MLKSHWLKFLSRITLSSGRSRRLQQATQSPIELLEHRQLLTAATHEIAFTVDGNGRADNFGLVVSGAGDVDGDGFDDIIVGAQFDDNGGADSGSAQVFSGKDGAELHRFNGSAGDRFGRSVGGAGDVNGDGFDDLIVGIPVTNTALVFSGKDGTELHSFGGTTNFGWSVGGVGDINEDGFEDVIVGSTSGNARVFSGKDGAELNKFVSGNLNDRFGGSVDGAGDVDGDGIGDIIIGASRDDNR